MLQCSRSAMDSNISMTIRPHDICTILMPFVLHVLHEDKNVLEELLTSNKVFSSYFRGTHDERQIKKAGGKEKYAEAHDLQAYNLNPFKS